MTGPATHRIPRRISGAVAIAFALATPAEGTPRDLPPVPDPGAGERLPFVVERVDEFRVPGLYTSLALDAEGNPWIAYHEPQAGDLRLATRRLGVWTVETVDFRNSAGFFASLAFDPEGQPVIAHFLAGSDVVLYVTRTPTGWKSEPVDVSGDAGAYLSMGFRPGGEPHMSYYDFERENLRYAERGPSGWSWENVDEIGDVGLFTSLACDAEGEPYISYCDATRGDLKLAKRSSGIWRFEVVDSDGDVGLFTSLAFGSDGRPRISYFDYTNRRLKFAERVGPDWRIESVAGGGSTGLYTSLALDANDDPWIAFFDEGLEALRIAYRQGGVWHVETVDAEDFVGEFASLALDAEGNPRISYYDRTNGNLKFADASVHLVEPRGDEIWTPGERRIVRWRGGGTVAVEIRAGDGAYLPLGTGAGGALEITVPPFVTERARVRVRRASPSSSDTSAAGILVAPGLAPTWWWHDAIDTSGFVGSEPSLAVDARGAPRVAYRDLEADALRYAEERDGRWHREVVNPEPGSGASAALALDPTGRPAIAHRNERRGGLELARKVGDEWLHELVDPSPGAGVHGVLAHAPALGDWVVAHHDAASLDLIVSRRTDAGWIRETVDGGPNAGRHVSLAVGAAGYPQLAYWDGFQGRVRHAVLGPAGWTLDTVPFPVGGVTALALALEPGTDERPWIAYTNTQGEVGVVERTPSGWRHRPVVGARDAGAGVALQVNADGELWLPFYDERERDLVVAFRRAGHWRLERVATAGDAGSHLSSAADPGGATLLAYFDRTRGDLRYLSMGVDPAGVEGLDPWPVGAERTVRWRGAGPVELRLRPPEGGEPVVLATGVLGGEARVRMPATVPGSGRLEIARGVLASRAASEASLEITRGVTLLAFQARALPAAAGGAAAAGARLTWESAPGPADLGGYRLERRLPDAPWEVLAESFDGSAWEDPAALFGTAYRLTASNGVGEEFLLGEVVFLPETALLAWPGPYAGGTLRVAYRVPAGTGALRLGLLDGRGRLVRRLATQSAPGMREATWDGRDRNGRRVAPGVYFLRLEGRGVLESRKLVVLR